MFCYVCYAVYVIFLKTLGMEGLVTMNERRS